MCLLHGVCPYIVPSSNYGYWDSLINTKNPPVTMDIGGKGGYREDYFQTLLLTVQLSVVACNAKQLV